jgi:hypothetical protein
MRAHGNRAARNAAISRIFSVSSADSGARDSWSIQPTFSPTACAMLTTVSKPGCAWYPVSTRLSVAGVMPASHAIAECFLPESSTASLRRARQFCIQSHRRRVRHACGSVSSKRSSSLTSRISKRMQASRIRIAVLIRGLATPALMRRSCCLLISASRASFSGLSLFAFMNRASFVASVFAMTRIPSRHLSAPLTIYWVVWTQDSVRFVSRQDGTAARQEGTQSPRQAREGLATCWRAVAGSVGVRRRDSRQSPVLVGARRSESFVPGIAVDRARPAREAIQPVRLSERGRLAA